MTGEVHKYAVVITGEASSLRQEAASGERSLDQLTGAARESEGALQSVDRVLDKASASAAAFSSAERAAAGGAAEVASETGRSATQIAKVGAESDRTAAAAKRMATELAGAGRAGRDAGSAAVGQAPAQALRSKLAAERAVGRQTVTVDRGADIAAYGREMDGLRAKYSPLFAAQQAYLTQLREISQAEKVGALTANEAATARQRLKTSFATEVRGVNGQAGRGGKAAAGEIEPWRRTNARAQYIDTAVSLWGGMNPLTVAVQQGPQLVEAYGGVKETISAVTAAFTPLRVAIGGTTALVVAGAVAWNGYLKSTKEVEAAAAGLGRNSGATTGRLEAMAQGLTDSAGLSIKEIRSLEAQLLRTGKIGVESFAGIIGMTKDFAATIDSDVDAASQRLAEIFADPAKGAEQLHRQYGLIDGSQARYVQKLAEQNKLEEARLALVQSLDGRLVKAGERLTWIGRVAAETGRRVGNFWDTLGSIPDRLMTERKPEQELSDLRGARDDVRARRVRMTGPQFENLEKRIRELEQQIADSPETKATAAAAETARRKQAGDAALAAATGTPANALQERRTELTKREAVLSADLTGGGLSAEEQERVARALDATRTALGSLITETDRKRQLDELDLKIAAERNPVQRAELEARRRGVELAGQEITSAEKAAEVQNARTKALNDSTVAGRAHLQTMNDELASARLELALVGATNAERTKAIALLRAEQQIRDQGVDPKSAAAGQIRDRAGQIADITSEADRRGSARNITLGQREEAERIALESRLIGVSNEVRAREIALLEARQRIRQEGIGAGSAEARMIEANAEAIAKAGAALEREKAAWEETSGVMSRGVDRFGDVLKSNEQGWASWKTAILGVLDDVKGQMVDATFTNPLKNALTGSNLPTAADMGGAIGRLFGFGGKGEAAATASPAALGATAESAMWVKIVGGLALGGALAATPAAASPAAQAAAGGDVARSPMAAVATDAGAAKVAAGFGANGAFGFAPNYKRGVDPRLTDILSTAAERSGLKVEAFSGLRPGDPRFHGRGMATDVRLFDPASGKALPNYQNAESFRAYESFAQQARTVQMEKYPDLKDDFRWGGYFGGPKGKYGAVDAMHFDLAGRKVGMGGGSFETGLYPRQQAMWPGAQSVGMGAARPGVGELAAAGGAARADQSLMAFSATTEKATTGLDGLGQGAAETAKTVLQSATGVGGSAKALEAATAEVPAQSEGFFSSVFGSLGQGFDKILSMFGGGGGGGGGATAAAGGGAAGGGGFGFGNIIGSLLSSFLPKFHTGGDIGGEHQGALAAALGAKSSDERLIIARTGERVQTPEQVAAGDKAMAAALAPRGDRIVVAQAAAPRVAAPQVQGPQARSGGGGPMRLQVVTPAGLPLAAQIREVERPDGGRDATLTLQEVMGMGIRTGGSPVDKANKERYGLKPRLNDR